MVEAENKIQRYDSYKDSGVEWLGEIPEHWEVKKLKSILKFTTGGTPSSHESGLYDGNEPWVTISDMDGRYITKTHFISKKGVKSAHIPLTPKGSLLYSFKLSVGQVAFSKISLYTNEAIASFHPTNNVCLDYWYYNLPSFIVKNANTNIYGAYILNQNLIKNATLIVPPLQEQTKIAQFLDDKTSKIDQAIAIKEQQINLLKERKQILIHKAVTRGLDDSVTLKDSGVEWIGEIPDGWEVKRLKNLLQDGRNGIRIGPFGSSIKSEILKPSGYKIYGQEHVIADDFNKGSKYINDIDFKRLSNYELFSGDIVITMMGTTGKCKVVPSDIEKGIMDSHLIRVRTKFHVANPDFIAFLINDSEYVLEQINVKSKGSIMAGLNSTIIKSLELLVPPISEQRILMEDINGINKKFKKAINLKQQEIEKLKEYKSSLINGVVTGKVRVC